MGEKLAVDGGKPVRSEPFPSWPVFGEREQRYLLAALESGKWGKLQGQEVVRFERQFADYHEAKHAIAVVNGTVALRLALMAASIQAGDEVIVTPYSFLATASAVLEANATPVFADIELDTFNLDPAAIEAAITPRTRAIIPVHVGGLPCNMAAITELARRHNLVVLEDACHAHGASYRGGRVGAIGQMGAFSFQSSKNLCSGEGGILLSNDDALAERFWSLHNCGRLRGGAWYEHHYLGGNYRLSEFQGAILNAQFERLDQQAELREENGQYLAQRLAQIPGIYPQRRTEDCTRHSYHVFCIRLVPEETGVPRGVFLKAVGAEGVPASAGYVIPLYRQPVFLNQAFGPYTGCREAHPDLDYSTVCCPNCETISTVQGAWLEHRFLLGTRKDMDDIADAFEKVYENRDSLLDVEGTASC